VGVVVDCTTHYQITKQLHPSDEFGPFGWLFDQSCELMTLLVVIGPDIALYEHHQIGMPHVNHPGGPGIETRDHIVRVFLYHRLK